MKGKLRKCAVASVPARRYSSVRDISISKRAELTMRMNPKGIIMLDKVPTGGFYRMAIDIERLTAGTTRLSCYGSSTDHGKRRLAVIK